MLLLLQICSVFCYQRDLLLSFSDNDKAGVIKALNLDDLRNTDNPYFKQIVDQIYPIELQLIKQILLILMPPFWFWTCP